MSIWSKARMKLGIRREGMVETLGIGGKFLQIPAVLIVVFIAFCSLIPLYHVVMASFSDGKSLLAHSGILWTPVGQATWEGYKNIFKDASLLKGYMNTLIYVVGATFFSMVINITGGYVLSRETKLKGILIVLVMLTAMFHGGLIPTYMVIKSLGWVGTRWALLIPGCTNAFFVLLMIAGFRDVPKETIESGRLDGAGELRLLWDIVLPQAMSMGTVIILNSVILQWNSWFSASIYIPTNRDLWPLQLWIRQIVADNAGFLMSANADYSRYLVQYALIVIATMPILIAMPFFVEKMEKNIIVGAVKG
jgi:putative aldouronate transport system permease protein